MSPRAPRICSTPHCTNVIAPGMQCPDHPKTGHGWKEASGSTPGAATLKRTGNSSNQFSCVTATAASSVTPESAQAWPPKSTGRITPRITR